MKKLVSIILSMLLILNVTGVFAEEIVMYLNGVEIEPLPEHHQGAVVQNGVLYLPLRNVFEAMGAVVEWDEDYETVSGGAGSMNYKTTVGAYRIIVDGVEYILDEPSIMINDRTLIIPEAVVNCFGADVDWDSENSIVKISYDPESGVISTVDFTDLEESGDV